MGRTVEIKPPKSPRLTAREKLKSAIDKLSDEEIDLLSYRLRLREIEKEIAIIEQQIESYKTKRGEDK